MESGLEAAGDGGTDAPSVEFLILADHVESLNGKLYMMGGGWDVIGIADFRSPQLVGVGLSIQVPWDATEREHTFALQVQGADGAALSNVDGTFNIGRPPGIQPGSPQRAVVGMKLPILLPGPGQFAVVALIDGQESARTWFRAQVQSTSAPQA